jgi:cysteine-rich repeat protein
MHAPPLPRSRSIAESIARGESSHQHRSRRAVASLVVASLVATLTSAGPAQATFTADGTEYRPQADRIAVLEARTAAGTDSCLRPDGLRWRARYRCPAVEGCTPSVEDPTPDCPCAKGGDMLVELLDADDQVVAGPLVANDQPSRSFRPELWCDPASAALVVAWYEADAVCPRATVFDAAGSPAMPSRRLNNSETCSAEDPQVAFGSDGSMGVAFYARNHEKNLRTVRWRRLDADGGPGGSVVEVGVPVDGYRAPEVAAPSLDSSGRALVAWAESPDGTDRYHRVRAVVLDADDQRLGPALRLNRFEATHVFDVATLAVAEDRFIVAWRGGDGSGWIARDLVAPGATPTSTTTTTTLVAPDPAAFHSARTLVDLNGRLGFGPSSVDPALASDGEAAYVAWWANSDATVSADEGRRWRTQPTTTAERSRRLLPRHDDDWLEVYVDGGNQLHVAAATDDGADWTERTDREAPPLLFDGDAVDYPWYSAYVAAFDAGVAGETVLAAYRLLAWDEVWIDGDDRRVFREHVLRVARSADGGRSFAEPVDIQDTFGAYGNDRVDAVALAAAGDDRWLLVWSVRRELRWAVSDDDGRSWSTPSVVGADVDLDTWGELALGCGGGTCVLAVSARLGSERGVYAMRSDDAGATWSEPVALEAQDTAIGFGAGEPTVARAGDGRWMAAWVSTSDVEGAGMDHDIVFATSADDGRTWSAPHLVDAQAVEDPMIDRSPALAAGSGGWLLVWASTAPVPDAEDRWLRHVRMASAGGNCGNATTDAGEECDDGNTVEGDGCDSNCTESACGNGIVAPDEACDDGNEQTNDACPAQCLPAICGDGFRYVSAEECDDANDIDTDACLSNCRKASCGDGIVREGVEECDDGEFHNDNNGECTTRCRAARCGDGWLHYGVEECDDGNNVAGDLCTPDCRVVDVCADVDGNGRRTATDALYILGYTVGLMPVCPEFVCDVDGSGDVTAIDALMTLKSAIGDEPAHMCRSHELTLRLHEAPTLIGAMLVEIDYGGAAGQFPGQPIPEQPHRQRPECELAVPGFVAKADDRDARKLSVAIITLTGIDAPADLVRCRFEYAAGLSANDFRLKISDVSDLAANSLDPRDVNVTFGQ